MKEKSWCRFWGIREENKYYIILRNLSAWAIVYKSHKYCSILSTVRLDENDVVKNWAPLDEHLNNLILSLQRNPHYKSRSSKNTFRMVFSLFLLLFFLLLYYTEDKRNGIITAKIPNPYQPLTYEWQTAMQVKSLCFCYTENVFYSYRHKFIQHIHSSQSSLFFYCHNKFCKDFGILLDFLYAFAGLPWCVDICKQISQATLLCI